MLNILPLDILYRLTIFYILVRELYQLIKNYGLPFFDEIVDREQKQHQLRTKDRNDLKNLRIKAENDLIEQSKAIGIAEKEIESWYEKLTLEQKKQEQATATFLQTVKEQRSKQLEHFTILTAQKRLLTKALQESFQELTTAQPQTNQDQEMASIITKFSKNG